MTPVTRDITRDGQEDSMTISEAYADLGGGLQSPPTPAFRQADTSEVPRPVGTPAGVCEQHLFDPVSGWCGCGIRDDGRLAEGSPAWRAAVEARMPCVTT